MSAVVASSPGGVEHCTLKGEKTRSRARTYFAESVVIDIKSVFVTEAFLRGNKNTTLGAFYSSPSRFVKRSSLL